MRRTVVTVGCLIIMWGVIGCRATVAGDPNKPIRIEAHVTIDVRQVKEEASSIEDMVSGKAPRPGSSRPTSHLKQWLEPSAWAEAPQLKITTPEIQKALDSRRDRFDALKSHKKQGLVGEDKEGHTVALAGGSDVQSLVDAENRDRETIYRAVVEQNNLSPDSIGAIRATFAEVQREKADPGERIQMPDGEWKTK